MVDGKHLGWLAFGALATTFGLWIQQGQRADAAEEEVQRLAKKVAVLEQVYSRCTSVKNTLVQADRAERGARASLQTLEDVERWDKKVRAILPKQ